MRLLYSALLLFISFSLSEAQTIRTANFAISTQDATQEQAKEFSLLAEKCRKEIAKEWLGKELKDWEYPCPLKIKVCT